MFLSEHQSIITLQRWKKINENGCEKFMPGFAWLLLSKTYIPYFPSLYKVVELIVRNFLCHALAAL